MGRRTREKSPLPIDLGWGSLNLRHLVRHNGTNPKVDSVKGEGTFSLTYHADERKVALVEKEGGVFHEVLTTVDRGGQQKIQSKQRKA